MDMYVLSILRLVIDGGSGKYQNQIMPVYIIMVIF